MFSIKFLKFSQTRQSTFLLPDPFSEMNCERLSFLSSLAKLGGWLASKKNQYNSRTHSSWSRAISGRPAVYRMAVLQNYVSVALISGLQSLSSLSSAFDLKFVTRSGVFSDKIPFLQMKK